MGCFVIVLFIVLCLFTWCLLICLFGFRWGVDYCVVCYFLIGVVYFAVGVYVVFVAVVLRAACCFGYCVLL